MKKGLLAIFLLLFMVACGKETIEEPDYEKMYEGIFLELEENVKKTHDLDEIKKIKTEYTTTFRITYKILDENVVLENAKIKKTTQEQKVKVEFTITINEKNNKKEFIITVPRDESLYQDEVEQLVLGELKKIEFPEVVVEDLTFVSEVEVKGEKVELIWTSKKPGVIGHDGKVTREEKTDVIEVEVSFVVSNKTYKKIFEFEVEGLEVERNRNIDLVRKELEKLVLPKETNHNLELLKSIELKGGIKYDVIWVSDSSAVDGATGKIYRGENDVDVFLELTVLVEGISLKKGFSVKVLFSEEIRQSIVEEIRATIDSLQFSRLVTKDVVLINEVEISGQKMVLIWISNKPQVMSNDGKINKQEKTVIVEMKVSVIYKEETYQKVFEFEIEGLEEERERKIDFLRKELEKLDIPKQVEEDLELPGIFKLTDGTEYPITWKSNSDVLDPTTGYVFREEKDVEVILTASIMVDGVEVEAGFIVVVLKDEEITIMRELLDSIVLPNETEEDIELIDEIEGYMLSWTSSHGSILSSLGKYRFVEEAVEVTLTVDIYGENTFLSRDIVITVRPISAERRLEMAIAVVEIPTLVESHLVLKTDFDYLVKGVWESSMPEVIDSFGKVKFSKKSHEVTLTLILSVTVEGVEYTMNKEFEVKTKEVEDAQIQDHHFIARVADMDMAAMKNVELIGTKLELKSDATEGEYESNVYMTLPFTSIVGSWAAISSEHATVELMIKVKVGDVWSKYFSYTAWGLGLENRSVNSSDGIAKISVDEIIVNNSKTATGFQFKVILRRKSLSVASPKLSLVAATFEIPNYKYPVDTTKFPKMKDYEMVKLNQNIVPVIGDSICSPTSSTMLMAYKGITFNDKDEFPHRHIANQFRDHNYGFGNWVFNTVGMGAYGFDSYVKRMYSFEELQEHLLHVGPVAASIKGNTGVYTTNGHLIVVRGYRVNGDGNVMVLVNDPNIRDVYIEYSLEVFMRVWRGVIYVIE